MARRIFLDSLRWRWVLSHVLLTAGLMAVMIQVLDPGLDRGAISGLVAVATLMLAGTIIGRVSNCDTVCEAGVGGALMFVLVAIYLEWFRAVEVPGIAWVAGPFYAATFAMCAAWVGEMLQGTTEDAQKIDAFDWRWVFVCVICGFILEAYGLFLGGALFGFTTALLLAIPLLAIFLTGWLVAFFSPGYTALEPAVASLMMVALTVGLAEVWLADPLPVPTVIVGAVAGLVLGLGGGVLGELSQNGRHSDALRRMIRGF